MFNWLLRLSTALAEAPAAADAAADAATDPALQEPNSIAMLLTTMLPMVLIVAVFYFMMIRPQRKKDKKVKEMLNNLKAGDRICTIGGIYGTIQGFRDDNVVLSVGEEDMPMVIARWAVRNVEAVTIENDGEVLA
jgi:preprotein translocase subunit YajC